MFSVFCFFIFIDQARDDFIKRVTKELLAGDLTPTDFLKQLTYQNDKVTGHFMNFEDVNCEDSDDSSDDELNEVLGSQQTSFSSQSQSNENVDMPSTSQISIQSLSSGAPLASSSRISSAETEEASSQIDDPLLCKICRINKYDMSCYPCGHISCSLCWEGRKMAMRTSLLKKYTSQRTVDIQMKKIPCMFCRKVVESTNKIFFG